jgi:hypothetical protein
MAGRRWANPRRTPGARWRGRKPSRSPADAVAGSLDLLVLVDDATIQECVQAARFFTRLYDPLKVRRRVVHPRRYQHNASEALDTATVGGKPYFRPCRRRKCRWLTTLRRYARVVFHEAQRRVSDLTHYSARHIASECSCAWQFASFDSAVASACNRGCKIGSRTSGNTEAWAGAV